MELTGRGIDLRRAYTGGVDGFYEVDREALASAIQERDHLLFRFATISERLFIDFRTSDALSPPVVAEVHVLPPAASLKERMASIRRARPQLPRPERLNVIAWPHRVEGLERLDVLAQIRIRLGDLDAFDALTTLDEAYAGLVASELAELRRAIAGEGYKTLWRAAAR